MPKRGFSVAAGYPLQSALPLIYLHMPKCIISMLCMNGGKMFPAKYAALLFMIHVLVCMRVRTAAAKYVSTYSVSVCMHLCTNGYMISLAECVAPQFWKHLYARMCAYVLPSPKASVYVYGVCFT